VAALVLAVWLDLVSIPGLEARAGNPTGKAEHAAAHDDDD
jgi:hypothetical protein